MKIGTNILFNQAYGKYGIAAFNVFNAEQVCGIFAGADKAGMPIIIQITPAARNYITPQLLEGIIKAASGIYPNVYYSVHLDHGTKEHCLDAVKSGFYNSVMIDASHEDFEDNIETTRKIVDFAHSKGIFVEAELGILSGIEDNMNVEEDDSAYTDPEKAVEFVQRTNCDSLAVAVGTSHGAYKMNNGSELKLNILKEIQEKLPNFPIVLHGASNVPHEEVVRINNAGGSLSNDAKGIDEQQILEAIKLGVCKINIATDMRLIWARVHREFFKNSNKLFDPIIPGKEYMLELAKFVNNKCKSLKIN